MKNLNYTNIESYAHNYKTKITEKNIILGDDIFNSYGLKITHSDGTVDEYEDLTFTKEKINELCSIFTQHDVDESHIHDIICDFVDDLHSI